MSALIRSNPRQRDLLDAGAPAAFTAALEVLAEKVLATRSLEDILPDLAPEVCALFECERVTFYAAEGPTLLSKVQSGLSTFGSLRLAISTQSIAGFCAQSRRALAIADAYDARELRGVSPELAFLGEVDRRTGYRTKQVLVAPVLEPAEDELVGVLQLLNTASGAPFPAYALDGLTRLCAALAKSLRQRRRTDPVPTQYDALLANGTLTREAFGLALRAARTKRLDLEDILADEFGVENVAIGKSLAAFHGVAYEGYLVSRIKPTDLLAKLPVNFVREHGWLPIEETGEGLVVLCTDPQRLRASRLVEHVFAGRRRILYKVSTRREFAKTVEQFYGASPEDVSSIGDLLSSLEDGSEEEGGGAGEDVASAAADNELVKLVNKIIVDAYHMGASDIHIEPRPGKGKTRVRVRRDGSLMRYIEVPARYRNALVARLKIMCDLDISERRKPQDGKIKFRRFGPLDIELRVATIPTAGGTEDVVMRLLASGEPMPLEKLALSESNLERVIECIDKPYGLFLVCGPTGSGKTTTLHSVLKHLNTEDNKIWTAEDPVEITQDGLRQVQVNPRAGLTFATAMRAFLRADPDVIMVGEMRDKETTATGIEASLTGHLVIATLHTNSAPESVTRLLDMGMDPFNFADALLGILAQRLAKRLCQKCRRPRIVPLAEARELLAEYCEELWNVEAFAAEREATQNTILDEWMRRYGHGKGSLTVYNPSGCEHCGGTGYRGRLGLHELLVGSDPIKRLIQSKARVAELLGAALAEGMRTLKQDGIDKTLQGLTDLKAVRAVCVK